MNKQHQRLNSPPIKTAQPAQIQSTQLSQSGNQSNHQDIVEKMVSKIDKFTDGLHKYGTRDLVEDAEKLGKLLADKKLKTNQIRKFLDAINQLKVELRRRRNMTEEVKSELDLLRPKLAYAAARQRGRQDNSGPVEPLKKVLDAALKKVYVEEDFKRLAQLIESIIAYHKAAGGEDQ